MEGFGASSTLLLAATLAKIWARIAIALIVIMGSKKVADNIATADEQEKKWVVMRVRLISGHIQLEIAN